MSDDLTLTWWGHATASVQLAGVHVLTDPVLTARVAHLRRHDIAPPPGWIADADVVVLSHLHADHLHVPSLARLAPRTRIVGPPGSADVVARSSPRLAARVEQVRPGDTVRVGDVTIRAVAAHHDGRRYPWSRTGGTALGYVLDAGAERVWFAGDTGLFDAMANIGPVDVALVPVGGWGPTLGPHHLDPEQAADAVQRVGARLAVPVHYGTFWPAGLRALSAELFETRYRRPGRDFAAALAALGSGARAVVAEPGRPIPAALG